MPSIGTMERLFARGEVVPPPTTPGAAFFADAPRDYTEVRAPYVVLVETGYQTNVFTLVDDVQWEEVHHGSGDKKTTARFTIVESTEQQIVGVMPNPGGAAGLMQRLSRFAADRRVLVQRLAPPPDDDVLFDGYPQQETLGWASAAQRATFVAQGVAEVHMEQHPEAQVYGRHMRRDPAREWEFDSDDRVHTHWPCIFNAEGKPNRAKFPTLHHLFEGDGIDVTVYPFAGDGDPTAEYWTLAQALCYLVHHHHRGDMHLTVTEFWRDVAPLAAMEPVPVNVANDFATRMRVALRETPVESTNLRTALNQVLRKHGFRYAVGLINHYGGAPSSSQVPLHWRHVLRIWHPDDTGLNRGPLYMGEQSIVTLPRDLPFTDVTARTPEVVAQANPSEQTGLTIEHRAARQITVLGGRQAFEVTLQLRPGWKPFIPANAAHYPGVAMPSPNMVDEATLDDARRAYWEQYIALARVEEDGEAGEVDPAFDPIFHTSHPESWRVLDVLRKWIYPTDHRYDVRVAPVPFARTGYPERMYQAIVDGEFNALSHPAPIGASLTADLMNEGGARNWAAMPRLMRQLVGRFGLGETHSIVVEAFFLSVGWRRIDDAAECIPLDEECGLIIRHPNPVMLAPFTSEDDEGGAVEDNFVYSYLQGALRVRVTCTLYGDRRGHVRPPDATLTHARPTGSVLDSGERFPLHVRNPINSLVAQRFTFEPDPRYQQLSSVVAMNDYAVRAAKRAATEATSGTFQLWWIQPFGVGTQIDGIGGAPALPSPSEVIGVTYHRMAPRTTLHLEDHRSDPALAVE